MFDGDFSQTNAFDVNKTGQCCIGVIHLCNQSLFHLYRFVSLSSVGSEMLWQARVCPSLLSLLFSFGFLILCVFSRCRNFVLKSFAWTVVDKYTQKMIKRTLILPI